MVKYKIIHPIIGRLFWIPTRLLVGRVSTSALAKALTVRHYDVENRVTTDIHLADFDSMPGFVGVPRHYGREQFPDLYARAVDHTVAPTFERGIYPDTITPRDEKQRAFMASVANHIRAGGDASAQAATGSGKTVSFIKGVIDTGVTNVIIGVHQNTIKKAWIGSEELRNGLTYFFGPEWVRQNVGIVQQGRCEYVGKKIVIAMMPTLVSRRYPKEFYQAFSTLAIDEVHKCTAPVLSRVLSMFPARTKIGFTATPNEREAGRIVTLHLGEPSIISTQEVMKPRVFLCTYMREDIEMYADTARALTTITARLYTRNRLLARIIAERGYERGRQCLGLGDRVAQILTIKSMLIEHHGIPEEDIGVYVGKHATGMFKPFCTIKYSGKQIAQLRSPPVFDNKKEATRYLNKWLKTQTLHDKRTGEIVEPSDANVIINMGVRPEMYKPNDDEYARIERTARIVLATNGIFDTGKDVSRLDWGIELTPRGDVKQAVGRVLRILAGKLMPEWYSFVDKFIHEETKLVFGKPVTKRTNYKTPERLVNNRRISYGTHHAEIREIRNVEAAFAAQNNER